MVTQKDVAALAGVSFITVSRVVNGEQNVKETTRKKVLAAIEQLGYAPSHAIGVAWTRGRLETVNQMYGAKVFRREDKPTNGEFIAMVSDKLAVKKTA